MLKQSELNPDEQAQVFARADALFREESEREQVATAAAKAAEELGVPQEYLDRAAAQFHAEKAAKILAQNQRKRVLMAIGLAAIPAALAIFLMTGLMQARQAPMVAAVMQVDAPPAVSLNSDPATTVGSNVNYTGENDGKTFRLNLKGFTPVEGRYTLNLGFPTNGSLRSYDKISFSVKSAGISNVRVDLREGQTRWNSREISLSPQGQRVTLRFDELNRQGQSGNEWSNERGDRPDSALALVFKFGSGVNPPDAKGTVEISDVRFE